MHLLRIKVQYWNIVALYHLVDKVFYITLYFQNTFPEVPSSNFASLMYLDFILLLLIAQILSKLN